MQLTYRGQSYRPQAIASELPRTAIGQFRGVHYTISGQRPVETLRYPVCLTFLGVPYLKV